MNVGANKCVFTLIEYFNLILKAPILKIIVIMESKTDTEKNKQIKNGVGLLPYYFKIIGIVVLLSALVLSVVVKASNHELSIMNKELFKLLTMNSFILGLLFVAVAKDKVEDEMTITIRLKAMGLTFIWAVLSVIINPLVLIVIKEPISSSTSQDLVFSMLLA